MRIEWSPRATKNLHRIYAYILEDSVAAEQKTAVSIVERTTNIALFPRLGHPGLTPGTREIVLSPLPYVLVYRVRDSYIQIVRIWHGAQNC